MISDDIKRRVAEKCVYDESDENCWIVKHTCVKCKKTFYQGRDVLWIGSGPFCNECR